MMCDAEMFVRPLLKFSFDPACLGIGGEIDDIEYY